MTDEKNLLIKRMFDELPWLKRRVRKLSSGIAGRLAYRKRSREVPDLLHRGGFKPPKAGEPKHIVLTVIDSLRRDHVSLYGYERKTTPFLDSIAKDAAVFENAIAPSPWTYPSVSSLLTGLYPHHHGGIHHKNPRDFDKEYPSRVRREILALPEVLAAFGLETYLTTAVGTVMLAVGSWFKHSYNFFSDAERHVDDILRWLKKFRGKRTFTYFQAADLHVPIGVSGEYRDVFGTIADIPNLESWWFREGAHMGEPAFEQYRENRIKLYDCALRSVDSQISRLIKGMEKLKIRDSSLVLITSDHGDEFWDHVELEREHFYDPRGFWGVGHGHSVFQETIGVPLMCIGPGVTSGLYSHNVSLVDLVPTILRFCGIEHKLELDGLDLFGGSEERFILSEGIAYGYEKKAVLRNKWKLINSEGDGVNLLFDLSKDPKEEHNLVTTNTKELRRLKSALPRTEEDGGVLEVSGKIQRQLRALGYI